MNAQTLNRAKIMLRRDEGVRATPYRCAAGRLTIGVGHNLDDTPLGPKAIEAILEEDIETHAAALETLFDTEFLEGLEANRYLALLNLAFNLGVSGFAKFVNTIAAIKRKDWSTAGANLRKSKWYNQVGGRAERVISMLVDNAYPYSAS